MLKDGLELLFGKLSVKQEHIADNKALIAHKDAKVIDLEEFGAKPRRIETTQNMANVVGFCDYVKDFAQDNTKIFASIKNRSVLAVIDYHGKEDPSFCDHNVKISFDLDDDFIAWERIDGNFLSQSDLVAFLLDYADDFLTPSKADILEIVGNIKAVKKADIDSQVGNYDINKVVNSSTKISSGKGDIPDVFTLKLPVLEGFDKYEVNFRLAIKMHHDDIGFSIRLIRPHKLIEGAFNHACSDIVELSGKDIYGFTKEEGK